MAHSAGESVSALIADKNIETATVTANCRNSSPEMPGMKATGTKTDSSTSVMAIIGAVISAIASLVASPADELRMLFHDAFDVLDHHDGVVDHDADREHHGQQRYRICRIADREQRNERSDEADGHRQRRNQRRANAAEEEKDDDHHEDKGLDQSLLHLMDGVLDENRRIVGDLPGQIVGKALLDPSIRPRTAFSVLIAFAPGD